jgi:hypothetical protein
MTSTISSIIIENILKLVTNEITANSGNIIYMPDWQGVTLLGDISPGNISNKVIDAFENDICNISNTSLKNGIDVSKLGFGTVTNEKLDCISDLMSPVQAQLDAKIIPLSYINIGVGGKTKSTIYGVQTKFIFPGTDYVIPIRFKCVGETDVGVYGQARIYHNNNVICESPTFTGSAQIIDFGNISNLPAIESILEVQLKLSASSGDKYSWLHALNIYY